MSRAAQMFDLSGRVALITGSTRGIGLAIARALGRAGALVVLNGRDADRLGATEAMLTGEGIFARSLAFDVTDAAAVEAAIDRAEREIGPLDILVNNAGMQHRAPLENFPHDTWALMMRTNIDSLFYVGQAVAKRMIPRKRGKIINIASVQAEQARPGIAPYAATKGAVKMLTKGMATEWARHGLQVNAIGPGYFRTELNAALVGDADFTAWLERRTPAGRWADIEEIGGAAVFLASDAASFVNGHVLYVDGGLTASL